MTSMSSIKLHANTESQALKELHFVHYKYMAMHLLC